jgi:hypothetical protein
MHSEYLTDLLPNKCQTSTSNPHFHHTLKQSFAVVTFLSVAVVHLQMFSSSHLEGFGGRKCGHVIWFV